MKAKLKILRVEDDLRITRLLRKHKKYRDEYDLNIDAQGLQAERLKQLYPLFYTIAVAGMVMEMIK